MRDQYLALMLTGHYKLILCKNVSIFDCPNKLCVSILL